MKRELMDFHVWEATARSLGTFRDSTCQCFLLAELVWAELQLVCKLTYVQFLWILGQECVQLDEEGQQILMEGTSLITVRSSEN